MSFNGTLVGFVSYKNDNYKIEKQMKNKWKTNEKQMKKNQAVSLSSIYTVLLLEYGFNSPKWTFMAVIRFCVNVPVLSLQIVVALPMVSHESNVFTKLSSSNNLRWAKAMASVTAKGRPSGMATTRIVIPVIRIRTIFCGSNLAPKSDVVWIKKKKKSVN